MDKTRVLLLIIALMFLTVFLYTMRDRENPVRTPIKINQKSQYSYKLVLTGDVMLGRSVMAAALDKNNPNYPFEKTYQVLKDADLTIINLENPVVMGCPRHSGGFTFCTDPKLVDGLVFAGVDVANLANNHTKNYGEEGFTETKQYLVQKGISYIGDNNLVIKKLGDKTFGFLGFDFVTNKPSQKELDLISQSDSKVDILVVSVHWGTEYLAKAGQFQREWARKMVTAGADVIVGHHPHWVQDMEKINGKPVYYSLGNFVFDQMWSEKTKQGLVMRLTFNEKGELVNEEQMAVYIPVIGQPEFK